MALALALTASAIANGALPRVVAVQQQDRAVRAYCAERRATHGIHPLNAKQLNQRVVTRGEMQYPTGFPECRPSDRVSCSGWIKATIDGLRHYGERSMKSVCSSFEVEGEANRSLINWLLRPKNSTDRSSRQISSPQIIIEPGAFPIFPVGFNLARER